MNRVVFSLTQYFASGLLLIVSTSVLVLIDSGLAVAVEVWCVRRLFFDYFLLNVLLLLARYATHSGITQGLLCHIFVCKGNILSELFYLKYAISGICLKRRTYALLTE